MENIILKLQIQTSKGRVSFEKKLDKYDLKTYNNELTMDMLRIEIDNLKNELLSDINCIREKYKEENNWDDEDSLLEVCINQKIKDEA